MTKQLNYEELAAMQPPMEHLSACICTQGPHGVILDYDCGRELERQRTRTPAATVLNTANRLVDHYESNIKELESQLAFNRAMLKRAKADRAQALAEVL